jgi:hypothetical protein
MFSLKKTRSKTKIRAYDLEEIQETAKPNNSRRCRLNLLIPKRQVAIISGTDHIVKIIKQSAGHICVHEDQV